MRYLTRGLVNFELNEDEVEQARAAYRRRLEEIAPLLPAAVQELAGINLHDGRFEHVVWEPTAKRLHLSLVTQPWSGPDRVVKLTYAGAYFGPNGLDILRDVANDRRTEILESEVDCSDAGEFIHRLLFWPRDELTIYCTEISLETADQRNDGVNLRGAAFSEVFPDDVDEE